MQEIIEYNDYREYKQELDSELQKSAESFVKIGYLLKVAKDTGILRESGYATVYEFAQCEYEIDKSQVSRFININDRFSESGYSDRLKEKYRGYGYAKLAIMLQLPDEINQELSVDLSKSEIQAVKEEVDAEHKISDIEVMLEEKEVRQQELKDILQQTLYQIGKDEPSLYEELWKGIYVKDESDEEVINRLAPAGTALYSVRIQGAGRYMLSVKENEERVCLMNVRNPVDKQEYVKQDIVTAFKNITIPQDLKESWACTYGEAYPEEQKPKVAPVQQKKAEPKKPSKVTKAKIEVPKAGKQAEENSEIQQEAQIPGQMGLENYPKVMPEESVAEAEYKEIESKTVENVEKTESEAGFAIGAAGGEWKHMIPVQEAIQEEIERVKKSVREMNWKQAVMGAEEVLFKLKKAVAIAADEEEEE